MLMKNMNALLWYVKMYLQHLDCEDVFEEGQTVESYLKDIYDTKYEIKYLEALNKTELAREAMSIALALDEAKDENLAKEQVS
jgi:hypothetical protein